MLHVKEEGKEGRAKRVTNPSDRDVDLTRNEDTKCSCSL